VTLPFVLSAPAGQALVPEYDGRNFVFGENATPVLEYSENFAGWSDDLTALHETAAGDRHPIDLASRDYAVQQVSQALPSGRGVIMEIGCSSGFLIKDLVNSFPQAAVIGADVVKEPLFKLAKTLPGVPLIRFDLLQCPLPDACVDVLVMLNVLEHIENDDLAVQNAFKLLKPGGSLVIEVPAGQYLYDAYDAQLHHFRRYSASELRSKLTRAGFTISRKSHLGFLLFPAFAAVKLLNKIRGQSKAIVRDQVASTSSSALVVIAMRLEAKLLSLFSLPYGVRVLMTAKRNL